MDVTFYCKSGHGIPLFRLLSVQSEVLKTGLHALLEEWNRQFEVLIQRSQDAGKNGFLEIAEIYARYAGAQLRRIEFLRRAFAKTESSRLLRVPPEAREDQRPY